MEDFKRIVKMKTGGSVSKAIEAYEKRERKTEMSDDIAQDKSIVKKGVSQHEAALHKGEPKTELKLKQGGRTKKAVGTVKKYKCGGGELKQIGFVAQELETVFPSLIDDVPDLDENKQPTGEVTKGVKLTVMIPILVKAMQEQQALITDLTTRLAALEGAK